jgi:hypothetical protein
MAREGKESVMRIRDLKWKEIAIWPPEWWASDEGAGETGTLKSVQIRYDQRPACLSVVAIHRGEARNGIILLEDLSHLETLSNKLKENLGRPLVEIGDLNVDFPLSLPKKGLKQVRPHGNVQAKVQLLK